MKKFRLVTLTAVALGVFSCAQGPAEEYDNHGRLLVKQMTVTYSDSPSTPVEKEFCYDEYGRLATVTIHFEDGKDSTEIADSEIGIDYSVPGRIVIREQCGNTDLFNVTNGRISGHRMTAPGYDGDDSEEGTLSSSSYSYDEVGRIESEEWSYDFNSGHTYWKWSSDDICLFCSSLESELPVRSAIYEYSYGELADNYTIDIIAFLEDLFPQITSLPYTEGWRSAHLPVSRKGRCAVDGEGDESEWNDSFEYGTDEQGRVISIIQKKNGKSYLEAAISYE